MKKQAISKASKSVIGLKVFPTLKLDPGKQGYKSPLDTGMVDATLIAPAGEFFDDEETRTWIETNIQKIGKGIAITREDKLADSTAMTRKARRAGKKIAEKVDDMIFNGGTSPLIYGAISGAGNTYGGSAWTQAPATPNTIYADTLNADDKLAEDFFEGGRRLITSRVQWKEIRVENIQAGKAGMPYLNDLDSLLGKGNTVMSHTVPDGTAVLAEPGLDNFLTVIAEDLTEDGPFQKDNQVERILLFMRCVPHRHDSESLCSITGI